MANGITGLSPFPTMGGGNQGAPGITPVQIQPTRVSFPTARTRAPTPETNELSAGEKYLPGILSIAGLIDNAVSKNKYKVTPESFKKEQERISELKKQGLISDEVAEAELKAFAIYGPDRDTSGVDAMTIAGTVGTLFSGRTSGTSAAITNQFANRKNTVNQSINTSKNQFKKESLKKDFGQVNILDYANLTQGQKPNITLGISSENDFGTDLYVPTEAFKEDDPILENAVNINGKNYIKNPNGFVKYTEGIARSLEADGSFNFARKDALKDLRQNVNTQKEQDAATAKLIGLANPALIELKRQDAENMPGTTTVASFASLANDVRVNVNQLFGDGKIDKFFGEGEGGLDPTTFGKNASSKQLLQKLLSLDENSETYTEDVNTALGNFINTADIDSNSRNFLKNNVQKLALNNAKLASLFLNIAYYAAGTAGQTGRTLSDKDLANFFRIIGGEGSQDPRIKHDILLDFINRTIEARDDETGGVFSLATLGERDGIFGPYGNLNLKNKETNEKLGLLRPFYNWEPNADGEYDYTKPSKQRTFFERNATVPSVVEWLASNQQRIGADFETSSGKTGTQLDTGDDENPFATP